jgi:hypothetical protein
MSDVGPRKLQRGDQRLMLTCMVVERLCTDRVPASVRLEAAIGKLDVRTDPCRPGRATPDELEDLRTQCTWTVAAA